MYVEAAFLGAMKQEEINATRGFIFLMPPFTCFRLCVFFEWRIPNVMILELRLFITSGAAFFLACSFSYTYNIERSMTRKMPHGEVSCIDRVHFWSSRVCATKQIMCSKTHNAKSTLRVRVLMFRPSKPSIPWTRMRPKSTLRFAFCCFVRFQLRKQQNRNVGSR